MSKKVVHIISHSHWDREWYMPFEKHRLKLVDLIDDCLELFEQSEEFKSFHLDGQSIILDDYLEVKPDKMEMIKKNILADKFYIGPWYILQDEFLTSGESNIRNLLIGIEEANKYGKLCKIGYFPDAFGNAGQMPQILKQAGMEAVIFGRGVKPVGFNNSVPETGEYESFYSEMRWNAPDGSGLLGILFANWYNNGAEIPVKEAEAKKFWDKRLQDVLRFASTDHLLFMNGCDHQPVQKDLAEAIATANRLYPDMEFIHSNFSHYVKCVKESQTNQLSVVTGELTSQMTDGWNTLVNTTSSRVYLKQLNRENEAALANLAEPLAVLAADAGFRYPHETIKYAWKKLMQNHPHDSICGCSTDEVHKDMETRFHNSLQVSECLINDSMYYIGNNIDTSCFKDREAYPFTVFNTTGWKRTGVVSVLIDVDRIYGQNMTASYHQMKELPIKDFVLEDHLGDRISFTIKDSGVRFGYDLPEDKFRQPYMARSVTVTFEAKDVPALGYKVYALVPQKEDITKQNSLVIPDGFENSYLKATINSDGTLNLLDKTSDKYYEQICYYEDTGDIGNEYIYRQPEGDKAILSKNSICRFELTEDETYRATYKITQVMEIPESADDTLYEEQISMTNVKLRKAKRSINLLPLEIITYISLEKNGRGIKVKTEFENRMKDHRFRVIIPTGLETDRHFTDSVFEVVDRPNRHYEEWENPSGCEHQQCFTGMKDEKAGIVAANFGLYEYEILPEQNNAIAITLLRAVGELGDWGVFLTPYAQIQKKCTVSFEIIPFSVKDRKNDPLVEAYQFQVPMNTCQIFVHNGVLPPEHSSLEWEGEGIYLTGIKYKQNENDRIIRFVNGTNQVRNLKLKKSDRVNSYYRSNVIEEHLDELTAENQEWYDITVNPYEIVTIGMENS
ncbi:alpha-mannosidase [Anaerocolumna sp. MB42-C2]|uniref:alpha-mannosidase n=1 Tax=Anaerocolumna sp. MB42-C2 TaxID=3070997 RepID=UPI0027DF883A|nr:alpha-mannosidase [Anaerocolumna sp. MB42-C2]WMJ86605.1 alpha-mannosidase [Anaerocolumna sp. MB42-C2]